MGCEKWINNYQILKEKLEIACDFLLAIFKP